MNDDEIAALQAQRREIQKWFAHPLTAKVLADNKEQQDLAVKAICDNEITDVATFFTHFSLIGHLRGLRRAFALVLDDLDEIDQNIKEKTE